jgi:hypothetical protein
MHTVRVSSSELAPFPVGAPAGIPWAPDSMPRAHDTAPTWLLCATGAPSAPETSALMDPRVPVRRPGADSAVVVRTEDGTDYVIEDGRRMRVRGTWVLPALNLTARPRAVRAGWLASFPEGPDLGSVAVDGRGSAGPTLAGLPTRVGQLVAADDGTGRSSSVRTFLVVSGGLMPVGPLAGALVLGDPASAAAYPGERVATVATSLGGIAATPIVPAPPGVADLPAPPRTDSVAEASPCAAIRAEAGRYTIRLVFAPENLGAAPLDAPGMTTTDLTADRFLIPQGGLLARAAPTVAATAGALYVVTGEGKFRIADDKALADLKYTAADASPVQPAVLDLLPTGPTLINLGGGA